MLFSANQPLWNVSVYMLHRIACCDVFIVQGEAEVVKGFQTQMQMTTMSGVRVIPLPVHRDGKISRRVMVDQPEKTVAQFLRFCQTTYGRFPGWREHRQSFSGLMTGLATIESLSVYDVGYALTQWVCAVMGIETTLLRHEQVLPSGRVADPSQWIVDMAKAVGADQFLTGKKAMEAYMDVELIESQGVQLIAQDFYMGPYYGLSPRPVDASISVLDPLFIAGVSDVWSLMGGVGAVQETRKAYRNRSNAGREAGRGV